MFWIFLYLELYLVEIIYVVGFILCWWHGFCGDVFDLAVTLCWCYIHAWLLGDYCRSDDYFLFVYRNCMIYCLIRNRALQLFLNPLYYFRPKLYVTLGKKNCPTLYVALQYQCNINVTFPIITLSIYYPLFFQFFHLSFSYYLLRTIL